MTKQPYSTLTLPFYKKKGILVSSAFNQRLPVEKQTTVANVLSMFSLHQEAAHKCNIHLMIRFFLNLLI